MKNEELTAYEEMASDLAWQSKNDMILSNVLSRASQAIFELVREIRNSDKPKVTTPGSKRGSIVRYLGKECIVYDNYFNGNEEVIIIGTLDSLEMGHKEARYWTDVEVIWERKK